MKGISAIVQSLRDTCSIFPTGINSKYVWVGGHQTGLRSSSFIWVDGTTIDEPDFWSLNFGVQPNDISDNELQCIIMKAEDPILQGYDWKCSSNDRWAVCELFEAASTVSTTPEEATDKQTPV